MRVQKIVRDLTSEGGQKWDDDCLHDVSGVVTRNELKAALDLQRKRTSIRRGAWPGVIR